MNGIVSSGPHGHATSVPHLVGLLQELHVKDIVHIRVVGIVDMAIFRDFVYDTHQHKDLIALAATVEEAFLAAEPKRMVLLITIASDAADNALGVNRGHQHGVLNGAEGANEGGRLQVLVELNDSKGMLNVFAHGRETHVAAKLFVVLLRQILWVQDCGFGADTPVPIGIQEAQAVRIHGHQLLHVLWHGLGVELKVFWQHTPPVAVTAPGIKLACHCTRS
mmetsp:Transcript_44112/g.104383  ORF Transcript_44112/g.104383 Transcript_44112/m.104383 type:complete len:221 (-) Transcript_44112:186-848(-)